GESFGAGSWFRLPAEQAAAVRYQPTPRVVPIAAETERARPTDAPPNAERAHAAQVIHRAMELHDPERVDPEWRAQARTPAATDRVVHDPPRTPTEKKVAALWAELLGVDRVGLHDEF